MTANSAALSWTAIPGTAAYQVRYRRADADAWTTAPDSTAAALTVSELQPGTSYVFRVRAKGDGTRYLDERPGPRPLATHRQWHHGELTTQGGWPSDLPEQGLPGTGLELHSGLAGNPAEYPARTFAAQPPAGRPLGLEPRHYPGFPSC